MQVSHPAYRARQKNTCPCNQLSLDKVEITEFICHSSGRGSPSSRNAYRLDTDTINLRPLTFLDSFSEFKWLDFVVCTTEHVAICLALATRTNEVNEARKASQSRSLRRKSLKKRPGAKIHDKTMCHQLFRLLVQGNYVGCSWNGPLVSKIASYTQRL